MDQRYQPRLKKSKAQFIQEPSLVSAAVGVKREEAGKRMKEVVSGLHFLHSVVTVPEGSFI